jgi:hypothetical protein
VQKLWTAEIEMGRVTRLCSLEVGLFHSIKYEGECQAKPCLLIILKIVLNLLFFKQMVLAFVYGSRQATTHWQQPWLAKPI